jgi:hypothetical protein
MRTEMGINFRLVYHRLNMGKHLKQNRYNQFLILYYYTGLKLHCTNAQDVKSIYEDFENDLQIYVKLFTILYADDTVLLAELNCSQS